MEQEEGVISNLFFEDGSHQSITEGYKFKNSGIEIIIEQMEKDNQQLTAGVPLVVWGAATCLSDWIDNNFENIIPKHTKKALELGSGTGLLGIYTIKALLKHLPQNEPSIILTDMEQSSIDLIDKNLKHNHLTDTQASTSTFVWGDFTSQPHLFQTPSQFDLIVGSDIIYSDRVLKPLAQTISHLLTQDGLALIANNMIRFDNQNEEFQRQLEGHGLVIRDRYDLKSVYTRGLNFQGQLGIKNRGHYIEPYTLIPELQGQNIKQVITDHSQNIAIYDDTAILYWGWPLCTRTTYRFLEHYEKFPRLLRGIQKYTPFFKNGIDQPRGEANFINPIYKAGLGCGYISVIDSTHKVLSWGDNYAGQLGTGDDIHREDPTLINSLVDEKIVDMSLGFQHCLYLNDKGEVFGIGKNNRFQMGRRKDENNQDQQMFDKYQGAVKLDYFDEPIAKIGAGKFHSVFLTESGKLYTVGFNKYGQCGLSNSLYLHAEEPVEVFTDNLRIKDISVGWHHTLIQSEDNMLYGFGARKNGQLDGTNYDGREEQCSIIEIKLPTDRKITKFKAQNLRNYILTDDNQVWFWGGYIYQNYQKLCIDGFNLLNEEEGIPQDKKIIDYGLGFAHDTVLIEEDEPKPKIVIDDNQFDNSNNE